MQRLPVTPYAYDVPMFQAATVPTTRDGMQGYQGSDSKFTRADESPVSIQGNPHVAAGNLTAHQQAAYLNAAAGQLPYGYTYAYQPGVLPQGPSVYPSAIYQLSQGKGVAGTQYQSQYQQQQQQQAGYTSSKFTGSGSHEYKGNYHNTVTQQQQQQQAVLSQQHGKQTQHNAGSSSIQSTTQQSIPQSVFKSHYNQDGKGFLGNSPTSLNAQGNIHMHNPHMNHYLLQQQQQQQQATHMGAHHVDTHRAPFSVNQQKRNDKGYQSYWSGGAR